MPARAVLVGPMGAGKTTVGRLLARTWGLAVRDTDEDVETAAGKSVQEIFVDDGEAAFRALEKAAVAAALAEHDGVVSLGGGAVLDPETRAMLAGHRVVFLRVGLAETSKRVGLGSGRPLLLGNVRSRIKSLLEERTPVYEAVATLVIDTDGRTPEQVAAEIEEQNPMTVISVGTSYDVVIGRGLADELPKILGEKVERVALLYAGGLGEQAERFAGTLAEHYDVHGLGLPDGEASKTYDIAVQCWEALGELGFTRSDVVVTFGGGATTDLGGFVAASWLRGVRVVHVPTTLLAMVDAAVGGKTGINTSAGKNLVGAFHEPAGVLCDLDLLATLPAEELVAGLGEVVKCGFIADPEILRIVESTPSLAADSPQIEELVERAVRVKAEVVAADLRETGGDSANGGHPGREVLNYGHTLAHAIEKHSGYEIRHGEAVAIGCVYAAEIAARSGLIDDALLARHRAVFGKAGLPTSYSDASFEELIGAMRVDKKARGSVLRFLVLRGLADPTILAGPSEDLLREAFEALRPREGR